MDDNDDLNASIDNYVRIKVLGRGAFGEAVLYRKTATNELVVWKEINIERCSKANRDAVDNEIEILATLQHTNIIAFYNHFADDKSIYIEMEFAEGGSLQHQIADRNQAMLYYTQEEVIWLFYQIVRGLNYMHSLKIMHRDLKTLNIFITRAGVCKLGDFGLSKIIVGEDQMTETVVGTPYYMSPELVKGEKYNFKSDIWALGCILHETLTLKKTFQATNTLKLAAMVVDGKVEPIDQERYTEGMAELVNQCLDQEPEDRPSTSEILYHPLMRDLPKTLDHELDELAGPIVSKRRTKTRSSSPEPNPSEDSKVNVSNSEAETMSQTLQLGQVHLWGGSKKVLREVSEFTGKSSGIIDVACGSHHIAVVSVHKQMYTWNNENVPENFNNEGQLGHHGDARSRVPKMVESLFTYSVKSVACGTAFTIALTDNYQLFAFGSNYCGALGQGKEDLEQSSTPLEIEALEDVPIVSIAAGTHHVLAMSTLGQVYSWGSGEMGRLGLGDEDDRYHPCLVKTPPMPNDRPKNIHAGSNTSFILTAGGRLLSFGCNEFNKLGLNIKIQGVQRQETVEETAKHTFCFDVPFETRPKLVKSLLRQKITRMSSGENHSLVLEDCGRVYAFGANSFGQLGQGHSKESEAVYRVRGELSGQIVTCILAGDRHSIASGDDGVVYGWGCTEDSRLLGDFEPLGKIMHPRKLFGSSCKVMKLASYGWTTIMAAEKLVTQKTIRVTSSLHPGGTTSSPNLLQVNLTPNGTSRDSGIGSSHASSDTSPTSRASLLSNHRPSLGSIRDSSFTESANVPAWLKKELASSIVPLSLSDSLSTQQLRQLSKQRNASLNNRLPELKVQQDLAALVSRVVPGAKPVSLSNCTNCEGMHTELQRLKAENEILRHSIEAKRKRIGLLESRLVSNSVHMPSEEDPESDSDNQYETARSEF